jgi:LemA protein
MGKKIAIGCVGLTLVFVLIVGVSISGIYNSLVQLDQATQAQWAQVQNAYQRRADLVPNLVATVKGAANFEQSTMTAVTEARAKVGQVTPAARFVFGAVSLAGRHRKLSAAQSDRQLPRPSSAT